MKRRNVFGSEDHLEKPTKVSAGDFLHLCACFLGPMVTIFWLFQCGLSVANALQDVNKYEHTGTFSYFLYYLDVYMFTDNICALLVVAAEMLIYIVLYRRVEPGMIHWGYICCFAFMMALHVIVWVHAKLILSPVFPYDETVDAILGYTLFANMTALPAVVYAVSYIVRVRNIQNII